MVKHNPSHVMLIALLIFFLAGCTAVDDFGESQISSRLTRIQEVPTPEDEIGAPAASILKPLMTVSQLPFDEESLIDLYAQSNSSVVNIRFIDQPDESETLENQEPLFREFPDFSGFPDLKQFLISKPVPPGPRQGSGSGFVYDNSGYIVTNNHVVAEADRIVVTFADDTESDATLIGRDPDTDLAVVKVDELPTTLVPMSLGNSDTLRVGQLVVAIGNPYGLEGSSSMTIGIISGLGRMLPTYSGRVDGGRLSIPDIIQTDAAINSGNSGGPLLTIEGEVVGLNTAIESPLHSYEGLGYAIPSNTIAEVVPQLIAQGSVDHPWLGIEGTTLTVDLARAMGLQNQEGGVLVAKIVPDSPADKAGLRGSESEITIDGAPVQIGGDIIIGIDDQPVAEFDDLLSYIVHKTEVGQQIILFVLRENVETLETTVTLEARPISSF